MYAFIFESRLTTTIASFALLFLACLLTVPLKFWWRIPGVNIGPIIGAGFMAAILLSDQVTSNADVFAALVFEFVILCLFARSVFLIYNEIHRLSAEQATSALKWCALVYLGSFLPSALSGGFGIFSAGTRIDYLYESSAAKYLTYFGVLLAGVLAGLLARRITLNRRPEAFDYIIILAVSAMSILAGSKGGFVLWIGSIVALIDYRQARIRSRTIVLAAAGLAGLVFVLAVVVAEFLRLSMAEFFDLAFNRFFLSNDARALAFDMRRLEVPPGTSLGAEAFRSFSSLFGNPPRNLPLGVELYESYFGPSGGAGANGSLGGLIILYTAPGDAALPFVLASLVAVALFLMLLFAVRLMHTATLRFIVLAFGSTNIVLFSQDFLAFQVVAPLTMLCVLMFYVSGSFHAIAFRRPQ
jgi:oligosaccharide repeat unit polymerase